jgi:hypothetical protein
VADRLPALDAFELGVSPGLSAGALRILAEAHRGRADALQRAADRLDPPAREGEASRALRNFMNGRGDK